MKQSNLTIILQYTLLPKKKDLSMSKYLTSSQNDLAFPIRLQKSKYKNIFEHLYWQSIFVPNLNHIFLEENKLSAKIIYSKV